MRGSDRAGPRPRGDRAREAERLVAPARLRQDRVARPVPAQAGQARRRRVRVHEGPRREDRRVSRPPRVPAGHARRSRDRSAAPRADGRKGLPARPAGGAHPAWGADRRRGRRVRRAHRAALLQAGVHTREDARDHGRHGRRPSRPDGRRGRTPECARSGMDARLDEAHLAEARRRGDVQIAGNGALGARPGNELVTVRFWGTRGSIPTPGPLTVRYGGNTACVEGRDSTGSLLILDAGTGLRELGTALMNGGGNRPFSVDLLLSHLHWDHIQGIPFFRPAYGPKASLRIRGPKQSRTMRELLGLGMDGPFFPVDIDDLPVQLTVAELDDGSDEQIGRFRVKAARLYHPAPALAYRVEADGKSIVYATDTEDAFSGRANPVVALALNADTLIHDAQFLDSDYKPTWGHSTISSAIDTAAKANVRRLVLYHHDPDRSDDALDEIGIQAQLEMNRRSSGVEVIVAREGLELEV